MPGPAGPAGADYDYAGPSHQHDGASAVDMGRKKSVRLDPRQQAAYRRRSSTSGHRMSVSNLDSGRMQPIGEGAPHGIKMTPQMVHMQYEMRRNHKKEQELKNATAAAAAAAAAVSAAIKDAIGDTLDDEHDALADDDEHDREHADDEMELEDYTAAGQLPSSRHSRHRHQRSSSPIIVWRPNLRVKIATDIPEELLRTTSLNYDGDQLDDRIALSALYKYDGNGVHHPGHLSSGARGSPGSDARGGGGGGSPAQRRRAKEDDHHRHVPAKPGYRPFEYGKKKKLKKKLKGGADGDLDDGGASAKQRMKNTRALAKKRYGAWYIPPALWADYMRSGDEALKEYNDKETKPQHRNDHLKSKLADLYSSKMYKDYILRSGYRLPHYLEQTNLSAADAGDGGPSAANASAGGSAKGGAGDDAGHLPSII